MNMPNIMNIGRRKRIPRSYDNANEKCIFYKMCINQFIYLLSLDMMRWIDITLPFSFIRCSHQSISEGLELKQRTNLEV